MVAVVPEKVFVGRDEVQLVDPVEFEGVEILRSCMAVRDDTLWGQVLRLDGARNWVAGCRRRVDVGSS